jgi:hypothetical protein
MRCVKEVQKVVHIVTTVSLEAEVRKGDAEKFTLHPVRLETEAFLHERRTKFPQFIYIFFNGISFILIACIICHCLRACVKAT